MDRTEAKIKKILEKEIAAEYRELAVKMNEPDSPIMPYVLEKLMNLEQAKVINVFHWFMIDTLSILKIHL